MTRFVSALLVARGSAVTAQVDPRTPGAMELGPVRSAALLIRAHRDGRAQRKAADRKPCAARPAGRGTSISSKAAAMTDRTPDPAAGTAPVSRRAARATVPGGPATSPAPTGVAGGKTSASPAPQLPGDADPSPAGVLTQREGGTPAGSTRLRGAEALKAIQRAQSRARRGPAVRKPAAKTAAPPVASSGASLTATATCLSGCGWTAGPGDPDDVNKAAAGHSEKAPKHATNMWSESARGAA